MFWTKCGKNEVETVYTVIKSCIVLIIKKLNILLLVLTVLNVLNKKNKKKSTKKIFKFHSSKQSIFGCIFHSQPDTDRQVVIYE